MVNYPEDRIIFNQKGTVMIDEYGLSRMLSIKEVARLLHVHANTLRRWSDRNLIRAYRINARGDRRFKREDIALFLAEHDKQTITTKNYQRR